MQEKLVGCASLNPPYNLRLTFASSNTGFSTKRIANGIRKNIKIRSENVNQKPWKKVYVIVPPTGKYIREERCQTPLSKLHTVALRPPMDLLYIAGSLE